VIESEVVTHAPRNVVAGAGRIATDAHAADNYLSGAVERQASAEHIDPADLLATIGSFAVPI